MSGGPAVPAPVRRVTTVRNVPRIKLGIAVAAAALAMIVVGALLDVGVMGSQVLRATARGEVGDTLSFDAEARRYDLVLVRPDVQVGDLLERAVGRTVCDVTLADGSTATVRGGRQGVSTETELGASIGSFEAVAGPTSVRCDHDLVDGVLVGGYVVAESRRTLAVAAIALIAAGIIAAIAAAALIAGGLRGKAVMH